MTAGVRKVCTENAEAFRRTERREYRTRAGWRSSLKGGGTKGLAYLDSIKRFHMTVGHGGEAVAVVERMKSWGSLLLQSGSHGRLFDSDGMATVIFTREHWQQQG